MALLKYLRVNRCPWCAIHKPSLEAEGHPIRTVDSISELYRQWQAYSCGNCGGLVVAWIRVTSEGTDVGAEVQHLPPSKTIPDEVTGRTANYLQQAIESLHAPSGAVMLAASAVDEMLKSHDYKDGKLHARIKQAAKDHLITESMKDWADEVRFDSNIERHADDEVEIATKEDADRAVNFALALAEYLFVLPAQVERGRARRGDDGGEGSN